MAGGKTAAQPAKDEADELFGEIDRAEQGDAGSAEDDFDDLLDEVVEDDSEGWVPQEKGDAIAGTVVKLGATKSDFAKDGEDPHAPTVTIENADGKFRVIGYGAVLRRELLDNDPRIGDKMAVKYFGEKPIKKGKYAGKPFRHFGVAIRRMPAGEGQDSLVAAMTRVTEEWRRQLRAASA